MKATILAIALATALASSVLAQSVGEKTGVNSALGTTPKTADFIKEAATSDKSRLWWRAACQGSTTQQSASFHC